MTTCPNHPDRSSVIESGYGLCYECRETQRMMNRMDRRERDAYLHARYNGRGDGAAADFVQWYGQPDHRMLMVHDAFQAWQDEMDNAGETGSTES
jgi:hypothetical protein